MRSKYTQRATWSWLRVRQTSCKISELGLFQFAVCRLIPNVTTLSVVGCVMNVTCETRLSQIARSVPLCDWSCQSIHCPKWIWSSSACQVQTFPYNPRVRLWQFSRTFHLLLVLLGDRPNKVWTSYEVGQPSCAQINTLLSGAFHVVTPDCDVFGDCSSSVLTSVFAPINSENIFCSSITILLLTCAARWVHQRNTWSGGDVGSSKSPWFCNIAPHDRHILILSCHLLCRQHTLTKRIVFYDEGIGTPIRGLLSVLIQSECSQMFCPIRVQPIDDHRDCAPAGQLDRQLSPNFLVFLLSVIWSNLLAKMK